MATVLEIPASQMAPEYRLAFQAANPAWYHAVVSGELIDTAPATIGIQGESDDDPTDYEVHLKVGPWWRDVRVCVPLITINGFNNFNADEDDVQLYIVRDVKWATDGEGAPNPGEVRIRLEFKVRVQGENSWVRNVGYYFTAAGRLLGEGGINEPGPVNSGP